MEIDLIQDEALAVLRVRGDLDLETVPTVRHAVRQKRSECEVVVVDLRTLDFIDSSGLGLVLEIHAERDLARVAFALPTGGNVGSVFDITGVRPLLDAVRDPRDVLGTAS